VRLDGVKFSRYTKGFIKPFDSNFHEAMCSTCEYVLKEFGARVAYTHSDEISMLFYPSLKKKGDGWREPHFGGRLQKFVSVAAGFATSKFNSEMRRIFTDKKEEYKESVWRKVVEGKAYFDARIFTLPDSVEMYNYLFWRSTIDCQRNAVYGLARKYYSKKELDKVNTNQRIALLQKKGVEWESQHPGFKGGMLAKKQVTEDVTGKKTYGVIRFHRQFPCAFDQQLCDLLAKEFYEEASAEKD